LGMNLVSLEAEREMGEEGKDYGKRKGERK